MPLTAACSPNGFAIAFALRQSYVTTDLVRPEPVARRRGYDVVAFAKAGAIPAIGLEISNTAVRMLELPRLHHMQCPLHYVLHPH